MEVKKDEETLERIRKKKEAEKISKQTSKEKSYFSKIRNQIKKKSK